MPVTLAQAKVGMADKIDQFVIDEFRRSSFLLDGLTFDNAVSPGTGGSTLTYGYTRLKTPSTAGFREINKDYTPNEADRENLFVNLKIFGGSYQIDRVIQDTSGQINEMQFQMEQKIKGAANLFHHTVINGDSAVDSKAFDGLDKALTGSSTEINTDAVIDLSNEAGLAANKFAFLDELDNFLSELDGKPSMLMGNNKLITKIKSVARRAGYLTQSEDAFGRKVDAYDGIPLVDLGYFYNGSATVPIVGIEDRTVGTAQTGLTDLYAVGLGLDGFHGVSPTGNGIIRNYLPNFNSPGAVKTGDVEMVAAVALKATRKAGVLRNIKVK
ncbi:major capsid protein [Bacillus sp. JJ1562]|uniref:major capsid protein n=1 Tax=Bacillus sp. JJ1562 TaxID=3122960 RepID=UPI0030021B22